MVELPAPSEPAPLSVYATTLACLTAGEMLADPQAVALLALARKIDDGQESGAGMAALARQHAAGLDAVLGRAKVADDPLDELAARRDAKLGLV